MQNIIYLVVLKKLQYFKGIPCLFFQKYIPPPICIVTKLCCNLNESSLVGEYGWYSVSHCTAVVVR